MSQNKKGPVIDGGTCRCCGGTKKCRLLNVEYDFCGKKEVYFEMFVDCFGLVLSHLEGEEKDRLICATCVMRLRDANAFRHQVLQCEEKLLQLQMQVDDDNTKKNKVEVKVEIDDAADMDNDYDQPSCEQDPPETSTTPKVLPIIKTEIKKEVERSRVKPVRRRIAIDSMKARREMILKLRMMREKLIAMQRRKAARASAPAVPLARWDSARKKPFYNIVTLVENSFVCPFFTTFNSFHCVYCKEMFTDPEQLRQHTHTHDPRNYRRKVTYKKDLQIDIGRIDCRLCAEKIDNLDVFYKHITTVHKKRLFPNIKNEFLRFNLNVESFTCLECNAKHHNFGALKKHMAEHFGTCICDVCGDYFFDENKLIIHQRIHKDKNSKLFSCEECGKTFKSKHGIEYHVSRAHTFKPTYNCEKCNQVFFSQILRYKHMMDIHGDLTRKFSCDECDKVYDTKKSLNEHNRKTHLKILNHECVICGEKFYLPSSLRDHMAAHAGEKNYKCKICGKAYVTRSGLRQHMPRHED